MKENKDLNEKELKKVTGGIITGVNMGMCPYCKKTITLGATYCPHCKREIKRF